jgi:nucleotide-binding universal stress UspA family protein
MTTTSARSGETYDSILHLTDFSPGSELAFAHALKIALQESARLTIFHLDQRGVSTLPRHEFPGVRATLQRWRLLEPDAPREAAYDTLGIEVEKVVAHGKGVVQSVLHYLEQHPVDLLVLATHGRDGLPRWLAPSIAEPVARHAHVPTLFVPHGVRGCVALDDGSVGLDQVLIPIDYQPPPQLGLEAALTLARTLGNRHADLTLLHVGEVGDMPAVTMPPEDELHCQRLLRVGSPVEEILKAADVLTADLIVMATAGHQGFLDALRGSTTEQVLRHAPCPVLAVSTA